MRYRLKKRKDRRRERRCNARHLDPHHGISRSDNGFAGDEPHDAKPRAEIVFVKAPGGAWLAVATHVLELLRLEVEDGDLIVLFM